MENRNTQLNIMCSIQYIYIYIIEHTTLSCVFLFSIHKKNISIYVYINIYIYIYVYIYWYIYLYIYIHICIFIIRETIYTFIYIDIYNFIYRFSVPGRLAVIIEHLRESLDKMLHDKFKDPTLDIYNLPILEVTCELLDSKNY